MATERHHLELPAFRERRTTCTTPAALPCRPGCPGFTVDAEQITRRCEACEHHPDDLTAVRHVLVCPWCRDQAVELGAIEPRLSVCDGMHFVTDGGLTRCEIRTPEGALITYSAWYEDRSEAVLFGRAWLRSLRGLP